MKNYFVDLHIHIGRDAKNRPIKISASNNLTLKNILQAANNQKGIDIIGIIDCHSPGVLDELEAMVQTKEAVELADGGIRYEEVTLILGSELELYDENCLGPVHVLIYLPTIKAMRAYAEYLQAHVTNPILSTQRFYGNSQDVQRKVKDLEGIFIPAHVFTPFKSLYGKGVKKSLTEVFDPNLIDAIELGLSADTTMADKISELHRYSYVSNSDSHSLGKIAREYQIFALKEASFMEIKLALQGEQRRGIVANYGLNPHLGKYYQTVCQQCFTVNDYQADRCQNCHSKKIINGVNDRINALANNNGICPHRPEYIYQVPLDFIPGIGPKTLTKLIDVFKSEMNIIHRASYEELIAYVTPQIAKRIMLLRRGELDITPGGGGKYGKVDDS